MIVNWPERLWVNSPVRRYVQQQEGRFFKKMGRLAPGGTCLEIGCGCGVGARIINEAFAPAAIHALDIDVAMLEAAKKRRKRTAWQDIPLHLMTADAQELPFSDQSFDAVFNYGIIHHLENWQQGVSEIARVLKDGGTFFFEEIYPPLYANPLFKIMLDHPRENRFHGPEFRAALADEGLVLQVGYKESRFAILGSAVKEAAEHS